LDAVRAAMSVLKVQYKAMSDVAASLGERTTVESLNKTLDTLDTFQNGIPGRIDTNRIKTNVKSTQADFNESMKSKTPEQQAEARVRRTATLSALYPDLSTDTAKTTVQQSLQD